MLHWKRWDNLLALFSASAVYISSVVDFMALREKAENAETLE